ncbi:MAG: patatin-like phospholipase family protein [Patescibacteria group bacterium]|jgi:NTE family protein
MKTKNNPKKIGLALGSGGQRGFALLGVLQALEEAEIKIDFISGASIGSLVAACYALSLEANATTEYLLERARSLKRIGLSDLRLSPGLIKGKTLENILKEIFKTETFANTKIPLRVAVTDLSGGTGKIVKSGSLASAVCASCSVPLIFEPLKLKNRYFVDGGLSNPVPVKTLKEAGAEIIIAVNLYHRHEFVNEELNLVKAALRTSRIALYHLAKHSIQSADLIISPDLSAYINKKPSQLLTPKNLAEMMAIGYQETKKQLPKLKRLLAA